MALSIIGIVGGGFSSDLGLPKKLSPTLKTSAFITMPQKTAAYDESPQKRRHASNKVPGHGMSDGMFSPAPSTSAPNTTTSKDSTKSPTPLASLKGKKPVSVEKRIKALSIISGVKSGEPLPTANPQHSKDKNESASFSASKKNSKGSKELK